MKTGLTVDGGGGMVAEAVAEAGGWFSSGFIVMTSRLGAGALTPDAALLFTPATGPTRVNASIFTAAGATLMAPKLVGVDCSMARSEAEAALMVLANVERVLDDPDGGSVRIDSLRVQPFTPHHITPHHG
jgi:hypothetical protein